ncbi:protein phosphatase CheZ [Curvivirga aplysinae]|uniref:protein phosphatase CheZ n=1 Tax=Curvivirga aplysinae TaxID=2529852 RepID=UPI0012BC87C9|nr:protein phosphatase CheZ [Curvivirga aplysinae]MTI08689.1 hypothetical protein [Curvivirga aplysinae]
MMSGHEPRDVYSVEKKGHVDVSVAPNSSAASLGGGAAHEIINAISALREEVAEMKSLMEMSGMENAIPSEDNGSFMDPEQGHDLELRLEVAQMVRTIAKAKNELAQIKHPSAEDDRLEQASSELDAIVMATETATNNILEATESIEKELTQIAALAHEDEDIVTLSDKIASHTTAIMEACNFQDITGQRITKVVTTMQFVEERIRSMIDIWGFDAFSELPVPTDESGEDVDPDADLLAGPQMEGQGISQAEIDALFD